MTVKNKKPFRTTLTEDDVPGAFLKGRKAEQLKNDELKCWLKCRGVSVSGTRMQLLTKVNIKCVQCFFIPGLLFWH